MEKVYHTLTEIVGSAADERFLSQLTSFEINPSKMYKNISSEDRANLTIERKEGINSLVSILANTGRYAGRSPDDRFIVYDDKTQYFQ